MKVVELNTIPASDIGEIGWRVGGGVWGVEPEPTDPVDVETEEPMTSEGDSGETWGKAPKQSPEAWLAYAR